MYIYARYVKHPFIDSDRGRNWESVKKDEIRRLLVNMPNDSGC